MSHGSLPSFGFLLLGLLACACSSSASPTPAQTSERLTVQRLGAVSIQSVYPDVSGAVSPTKVACARRRLLRNRRLS